MRRHAALAALSLLPLACGVDPPPPVIATPTVFAEAEPAPPAQPLADALDATPLDAPTRLPSLEVEGAPGALTLEALDVNVTVVGRLARTEVKQVFRNALARQVEGTYQMTLPDAAVISRLAMDVEGVMTEGELAEKERARQIYDSIVRAQQDPALLEWQGGNRFKMQVFPIPASGTKTIILEYEELLPVRGRRVQYAYGLPTLADGRGSRIGRFSFALTCSSTGAPVLEPSSGDAYAARLHEGGVWFDELDFAPRGALRVSFPRPAAGSATVLNSLDANAGDGAQLFLVDYLPELPPATRPPPRDLVLVLDTSRGLGDRELLRAAEVARALAARRTDGRVVVVKGDLEAQTCTGGAAACLAGLSAGGATNLEELLGQAARAAAGLDTPGVVLFSDGVATVGELDADVLLARFIEQLEAERTSVFTVAVGHEPDLDFLAKLASAGRGHPLRLTPAGSIDGTVEALAHALSVPLFLDVTAEIAEGDAVLVQRPALHLRPGEPLAMLGRGTGEPFVVEVRGTWNGEELVRAIRVDPLLPSSDKLVAHFWARGAIEELERAGAPRQDIVKLSLRYGVMSKATSFLVLENEAVYRRFGVERIRQAEHEAGDKKNLSKGTGPLQQLLGDGAGDKRASKLDTGNLQQLSPTMPDGLPADATGLGLRGTGGGELEAALGGIDGGRVGASAGMGGLGLRGGGPGGGGTGINTLGTGKVGTRGRGSGEAGYGSGQGGLGGKTDRDVTMTQGTPVILGSLDKEIIRRIVQEHASQFRYCYEKELTRTPGIFGKIVMKWVINGEGKVTQAQAAETQMRNANVEGCLATKIKTWVFPKPRGGGIVIINYPFVFKQAGGGDYTPPPMPIPATPMVPQAPPPPPRRQLSLDEVIAARRADLLELDLLLREVRLREREGDLKGARRTLSELVELAPHDVGRRQRYAHELVARAQLIEACEELGHVASLQPARRDVFRSMMALRRSHGAEASALRGCIVDGVSRLPVQRALSLVLTWEDDSADVDLHVIGPTGEHVFYQAREGRDGGLLYYDVTDGYGPEIYTLGQAHHGRYRLGVVHYRGPSKGVRGTLTVIEDAGTPAEQRRHIPFKLGAADPNDIKALAELRM